jgi:hypothetical protein
MERPVSFAAEDVRDEKVRTMLNKLSSPIGAAFNPTSTPGQSSPRDTADRAKRRSPRPIRGCQRETRLS